MQFKEVEHAPRDQPLYNRLISGLATYFNNKLLIRLMYSAGSAGKPPSAITA